MTASRQDEIVTEARPVNMVLFCPKCGLQHVDAPDARTPDWTNPPHRSHLCHDCGCIWRPADVPTNGVAAIETQGRADTWVVPNPQAMPAAGQERVDDDAEWLRNLAQIRFNRERLDIAERLEAIANRLQAKAPETAKTLASNGRCHCGFWPCPTHQVDDISEPPETELRKR